MLCWFVSDSDPVSAGVSQCQSDQMCFSRTRILRNIRDYAQVGCISVSQPAGPCTSGSFILFLFRGNG